MKSKASYTVDEVAKLLGVHMRRVYADLRKGKLKALKIGGTYAITAYDLEEYLGKDRAQRILKNSKGG